MSIKNKIGIGTLLLAALLVCTVLVSAVSAQENDYSITIEKANEHANANMIILY